MIKEILILLSSILTAIFFAFRSGKQSVENNKNKEVVKDVEKLNNIKDKVHSLPSSDRDKLVQKFTRDRD